MAGGSDTGTGKHLRRKRKCNLVDRCYIYEAIKLHDSYIEALKELDSLRKKYAVELNASRFTRDICRNLADHEGKVKSKLTEFGGPGTKGSIKISLNDRRGQPAAGEKYDLYIPGEKKRSGNLGGDGTKVEKNINTGPCFVNFPNRGEDVWEYLLAPQRYKMVTKTDMFALKHQVVRQWEEKEAVTADSYENSHLKKYIEYRENKIAVSEKAAEAAAEKLIKFIKSPKVQKHIYKQHSKRKLPDFLVKEFYGVDPDDSKKEYRESDHYLAILTEDLNKTRAGLKFLDTMFDEDALSKQYAFKDLWGFIGKTKTASEASGKFLFNIMPALATKINQVIDWDQIDSITDITQKNSQISPYFATLEKYLGKNKFSNWLGDRVDNLAKRNRAAVKAARNRRAFDRLIKIWSDPNNPRYDAVYAATAKKHDAEKALDGVWFGMALDTVAVVLSTYDIFKTVQKTPLKDKIGLVGDVLGALKTVAEAVESTQNLRVAVAAETGASGETIKTLTTRANAAKICVRVLTVLGVVVSAVVMVFEIYDACRKRNWRVVALSIASFGAMLIGLAYTGIGAVISIIIAIIAYLIYEPPVADFIQLSYWGEDYIEAKDKIPIKDTIFKYFEVVYTLKIRFIHSWGSDANRSYMYVQCGMLSDKDPIYVQVFEYKNKKFYPLSKQWKKVYPGLDKVDGKGRVFKEITTWSKCPNRPRTIRIEKYWEIWPDIKRDSDTKYWVAAALDPSRDARYALKDQIWATFPSPDKPKLNINNPFSTSAYIHQNTYVSYWKGKISMIFRTKYAKGCYMKLWLTREGKGLLHWDWDKEICEGMKIPVTGDVTEKRIKVPDPKDDKYQITAKIELYDANNEEKDSDTFGHGLSTYYVASNEYIDKLKET